VLPSPLPLGVLPPSSAWLVPLLVVLLVFVTLAGLVVWRVVRRAAAAAERTEELEARVAVLESEVDRLRGRSTDDD
jgi:type II secretory pathway pseudopilin PulG